MFSSRVTLGTSSCWMSVLSGSPLLSSPLGACLFLACCAMFLELSACMSSLELGYFW